MSKKRNYALEQYNKTQAEIDRLTKLVDIRKHYGYSADDKVSYEAALAALNRKEGKGKKGFDIGTKIAELKAKNEVLKKKLGSRQILQIPQISTGFGSANTALMANVPGAKGKMVPNQYYVPSLDPKSPENLNKLRIQLFGTNPEDMEFAKGLSYNELKQEEAIQKQNRINEAASAAQDQNWSNYQNSPTYDLGLGDGVNINITGNQPANNTEGTTYEHPLSDPDYNPESTNANKNKAKLALGGQSMRTLEERTKAIERAYGPMSKEAKRKLRLRPITQLELEAM